MSALAAALVLCTAIRASSDPSWDRAPHDPADLGPASRPRVVLLHAPWCQWCMVLEHEVLPDPRVAQALGRDFVALDQDVDAAPLWMDLPGIEGLPAFVFFDHGGRHVLTRSGYQSVEGLTFLLEVVAGRLDEGRLDPYPARRMSAPGAEDITPERAQKALERAIGALFMKVNDNTGGFQSPARYPFPALLLELWRWAERGGDPRARLWVQRTVDSALRGSSPRLQGAPLPDMDFNLAELLKISAQGPAAGPRWREGIERLPTADPYRGIQDPVDHGVFRYAAGPGWYHPHFERSALENMAWAMLLDLMGRADEAQKIRRYVATTFEDQGLLNASQRSDPFYYRLRADERQGARAPTVDRLWRLKVQARAARLWPSRCPSLLRVSTERWPRAHWTLEGEDPSSPDALPDDVGELLLALSECGASRYQDHAEALATTAAAHWRSRKLPRSDRLSPLASGLCAVSPSACLRALSAVETLPLSLEHPPPLVALKRLTWR